MAPVTHAIGGHPSLDTTAWSRAHHINTAKQCFSGALYRCRNSVRLVAGINELTDEDTHNFSTTWLSPQ